MGELYQLQATSPIKSRIFQAHSALTGVTGEVVALMTAVPVIYDGVGTSFITNLLK